jgi:hypothetical protein
MRARLPSTGEIKICEQTQNPAVLRQWAENILREDGEAVFEMDAWNAVLIPVATWHGDPVCPVHLYDLRSQEMRGGR